MKILTKISLAVLPAVLIALAGCESTGETQTDQAPPPAAQMEDSAATSAADKGAADAQQVVQETPPPPVEVDPLDDPESMLSKRTIYFEFDSATVGSDALDILQAHADYLIKNNNVAFTLEGHADERGTREYNIALGERRADAVRRILMANGVSANQIKVISYGEERPARLGHSESAWAANRRAELVYN